MKITKKYYYSLLSGKVYKNSGTNKKTIQKGGIKYQKYKKRKNSNKIFIKRAKNLS